MAERKMVPLPNTHYTVELRSGRVITIDEGFENLFGYTQADVDAGLVFKDSGRGGWQIRRGSFSFSI